MTEPSPRREDLEALARFDTPTVCNGLEIVAAERRAKGFTTVALVCAVPALPPIVGFARTATIRAADPSPATAAENRDRRAAYFDYIDSGPRPSVVVVQDLDPVAGFGAFWGEVNTAVHKGLGCLGAVTNGSMRDLGALAPGFQLLAGSVGPSHAHVHVVDFGGPVNVHGMAVRDGDVIHADRHGAVVFPPALVDRLPGAIDLIARREKVLLDASADPGFDAAMLRRAIADSADIH